MPLNGQEKKSIKVVLDTNVLISVLVFGGQLRPIFDLIKTQKMTPCFTKITFLEFQTVLQYPKFKPKFAKLNLSGEEITQAIAEKSIIAPDSPTYLNIISYLPDNYLLSCSIATNASFIVSGDKHLLKLKTFQQIPILSPNQFLQLIRK